jgi:hypothetical protein
MSTINNSHFRGGNFSSSAIAKLMSRAKNGIDFGTPALTYIHEKNLERYLCRSISNESNGKETRWGNLLEPYVFNLDGLGLEYTLTSKTTTMHPEIPYWCGSADGCKEDTVYDIKAPFTPKSFAQLVLPLYLGFTGIDAIKAIMNGFEHNGIKFKAQDKAEDYYWQLISNAILNNKTFAELIVYMPYQSELLNIRQLCDEKWLDYLGDDEIPCIPDGGYFRNLNIIRFEVPQADKDLLTETVLKAGRMLVERPNLTTKN